EAAFADHQRDHSAAPGERGPAAIANDRKQPCAGRAAAELTEASKGAEHRVLNDVLAQHRVAREEAGEVIGAVEMRQDQLAKICRVAGAGRARTGRRAVACRQAPVEDYWGNSLHW